MRVLSLRSQEDFFHLPYRPQGGLCLALGFFNGLHLGHQELLQATLAKAKEEAWEPGVFLFRSSPGIQLGSRPELAGPHLLMLEEDRLLALEQAGFAWALVCDPSPSVLGLPAKAFVEDFLLAGLGTKAVFCGEDFRFGSKAQGDVRLLHAYAPQLTTFVFQMVKEAGAKLSSTQIRHELKEGRLDLAQRALGRPFGFRLNPEDAALFASSLPLRGLPLRLVLSHGKDGKVWLRPQGFFIQGQGWVQAKFHQTRAESWQNDPDLKKREGEKAILYPPELTPIPEGSYEGRLLGSEEGRIFEKSVRFTLKSSVPYLALTQFLGTGT